MSELQKINVDKIVDLLEQSIRAVIEQHIVNAVLKQIVAIVAAVLIVICLVLIILLYISRKTLRILPAPFRATWLWKKIAQTPLVALVIVIIGLIPFLYLSDLTTRGPNFVLLALGLLLSIFAILKIKTCRRYFMLAAGIIFVLFATVRLGLFGYDTVTSTGIVNTLSRWAQVCAVVFIVFDHFMYAPTCRQQSAAGSDDIIANETAPSTSAAAEVEFDSV